MRLSDIDMLQDYEKDTRMAVLAYAAVQTEILDPALRTMMGRAAVESARSQQLVADLILSRGERP
ncbi:MAG TPA: hypothetical protein DEQ28_02575 [Clostridiales bacterium]|nr:hypothetical protein [Clostridiales bacterium]